jgi:hypothetical protein
MKSTIFLTILFFTALPAFARNSVTERADDKRVGQENCNKLLYDFNGNAQSIERIRALLVQSYSAGIFANPHTQISAMQVSQADAEVVQLLVNELEISIPEAVSEYANGNMTSAFLAGHPGELNNEIRKRSARSMVSQAPWLREEERNSLIKKIEKLLRQ